MTSNTIILKDGINIGRNGAEHDDEFLFNCFFDHPIYDDLVDTNSPSTFILGSTGAGKTALLRMILQNEDNVGELQIHDLAMNHISNSDTIAFLKQLDVDVSLFFQALWKHIFCVEYIKVAVNAKSKDQFRYKILNMFKLSSREKQREKLEKFITDNEDQFWNTIDENVIEVTNTLEKGFNTEFGSEIKKFTAKAGYLHNLGSQQKTQLKQRAKKFLNDATLYEIPSVIAALSDYTRGREDKFYITVDGLDEHWVDHDIKFQLLQALFESLKSLKKLRNFQVVVALRNDLYHRMVQETPSSQRQIEKFDDLIVRIRWSKSQLRALAEKRVESLFRRKYSSEGVNLDDIFVERVDSRATAWDYIFERTLRRPRDVINFINSCLQAAQGKHSVSKNSFLKGEKDYSDLRHETLIHEWSGTFPAIGVVLELLRNRSSHHRASVFMSSKVVEELFDGIGKDQAYFKDDLWRHIELYVNGADNLGEESIGQIVLYRLHLIGAVGLKLKEDQPWDWIQESTRAVSEPQITSTTKFKIHPMLFSSLNIRR